MTDLAGKLRPDDSFDPDSDRNRPSGVEFACNFWLMAKSLGTDGAAGRCWALLHVAVYQTLEDEVIIMYLYLVT